MNEKVKTKKEKSPKDKRSETPTLDTIRIIHKKKGQKYLFHLRAKVRGKWLTCGTFYPKIGRGSWSILPRGECEMPMFQLQYQPFGQSVYIRAEARQEQSSRTLQTKTTNNKVVRRGLPIKNKTLYRIK